MSNKEGVPLDEMISLGVVHVLDGNVHAGAQTNCGFCASAGKYETRVLPAGTLKRLAALLDRVGEDEWANWSRDDELAALKGILAGLVGT